MPVRLNRSLCEESVLLGPVERQIEFGQSRRSELDGLPALQDRFNQLRAQEGKVDQATDVAARDAVAIGQVVQRSGAAGSQLLKPGAPARDRLDQRRITSRGLVVLRQSGQHQLGFGAAPFEIVVGPEAPKSSSKVPDTHSVGAICDHNLGVFTVTDFAMENADAVSPAHPVPRTPKAAYPGLRRCGGSSVPLAFLTRLAAWQSLCTGHLDASLELGRPERGEH
jgi:hypothetical protein